MIRIILTLYFDTVYIFVALSSCRIKTDISQTLDNSITNGFIIITCAETSTNLLGFVTGLAKLGCVIKDIT